MLYSHTLMHLINKNNNMNYLTLFLLSTLLLLTACGADDSSPASIVYDEGEDIEISADMIAKSRLALGYNHSCFITADNGSVMCWGDNKQGQLGNGKRIEPETDGEPTFEDGENAEEFKENLFSHTPVAVVNYDNNPVIDAIEISASENHTCALLTAGNVKCWGSNSNGQLGNSQLSGKKTSSTAVDVNVADLQGVKAISVGNTYSCALLEAGDIKCWGKIPSGFSANNLLELTNKKPSQLATASAHACVVTEDNQVQCWGDSSKLGHIESEATKVTGIDNALLVSSKGSHSCALLNNGRVRCWGENLRGQIGNGDGGSASSTVKVPTKNVIQLSQVISLSSGEHYNCAVTRLGQVKCWGSNQHGQLGYISPNNSQPQAFFPESTVAMPTAKDKAKEVSVSQGHSCARLENDDIYCWGKNDLGQLGNGEKQSISSTPVKVKF